ncbi:MAG: Gldg family protein [Myxococcales bacterium]|nr:Gldg family protein [Myxococcales bacterium]
MSAGDAAARGRRAPRAERAVADALRRIDGGQLLQLAGVVAAFVLAGIVNVLGARHFARWDWTREKRWSLSPATLETLRALESRVDLWAIAAPGDPFEPSLRQMIVAYEAQSSRLAVHWIDPDRDAVQLVDLQRRFGLVAGRSEDGRIATDAMVVVASGEKHWFLTPKDLSEASSDDVHVRPREERALTQAIRSVLGGEKAKLCFTSGHGELALDAGRDERELLGSVRDLLENSNYTLATVDLAAPGRGGEPLAGCTVAVVAGAHAPFAPAEANRLLAWLLDGGSLFLAIGPVEAATTTGMEPAGLEAVLSPFGIALDDDLVHEVDPTASIPDTHGEGFLATVRVHPITAGLVPNDTDAHPPRVAVFFTRSLHHVTPPGASPAADLLVSSAQAFAKTSIAGASTWTDVPARAPSDPSGPFTLAMASERPARAGEAHPPRVVVTGSRFALAEENWRQPRPLHGAAFFVDNALSWLSARPSVVDVPDRGEIAAGVRISEEGRAEVSRYVLVLMPLAVLLLGASVWAWRRSSEGKPYVSPGQREPRGMDRQ